MRKYFFLPALALLTLASCGSDNDLTVDNNVPSPNEATQSQVPIAFGTYIGRSTTSRAGVAPTTGSIDTNAKFQSSTGFGVFAYSTGASDWASAKTSATPNYMYNERVHYNTSAWEYYPLKFWPNDNGTADNQGATGTTTSYVSFFAYAPYAGQDDDAGLTSDQQGDKSGTINGATTGITAISGKEVTGNPWLDYTLTTKNNVDLLWGTAGATNYATAGGSTSGVGYVQYDVSGTPTDGKAKVNIDITKPTTNTLINFAFKHALAKLGGSLESSETDKLASSGLQVQLDVNNGNAINTGNKPDETVVTIKSISIVNDNAAKTGDAIIDYNGDNNKDVKDKIQNNARLDLATGVWTLSPTPSYPDTNHTITSPASSSEEIAAGSAKLRDCIAEPAASSWQTGSPAAYSISTLIAYLNVKAGELSSGHKGGVQTNPENVYQEESDPLLFIPGTTPSFKVTVDYYVRTQDNKLASGYSESHQVITKYVSLNSVVELNKKYNLIIHLGLTDIRFTASVSDWDSATSGGGGGTPTPITIDVHTPKNVSGS